jgi:hypothetical protein
MSNETTAKTAKTESKDPSVLSALRKKKKVEGRKKRAVKLKSDKEFAKQYFEGKSKRAADKKSAFRKKKSKKK